MLGRGGCILRCFLILPPAAASPSFGSFQAICCRNRFLLPPRSLSYIEIRSHRGVMPTKTCALSGTMGETVRDFEGGRSEVLQALTARNYGQQYEAHNFPTRLY
ncbi:hypothetical protein F4802DRAFT_167395 [Xylaria palmicola]|nr:hypothetical protein F4802DRAFT_167395 [Xylaria palmicola]